ncbi:MAG: LysE family translocator [Gammaproteobacteria bacterium]
MPSIEALIAFTLAAFIMNLSPGPSNLYVMARTLEQGIGGGLAAVAGLATGSLVHVLATVLGLSALIAYSPLAYSVLKTAGALYLLYLGLSILLSKRASVSLDTQVNGPASKSRSKIFMESVIVETTNPKTALFFIALLPQFVNPAAGPTAPQLLLLGMIVTVSAIPCDLFVTFFTNKAATLIKENPNLQMWQDRVSGMVLTGLGAYVLFSEPGD